MYFEIIKFIQKETEGSKLALLIMSLTSGMTRGSLLATINAIAASSISQQSDQNYLINFVLFLMLYIGSSYYVKVNSTALIENARHRLTLRLCDKLLYTELHFVEGYMGRGLFYIIGSDVSIVCSVATNLLNSMQASVLLFFCLIYIAWLVPVALFVTVLAMIAGVSVYLIQDRKIAEIIREARAHSLEFTNRIGDLIGGFKELKINRKKRGDFINHFTKISSLYKNLNIRVAIFQTITFLTSQVFIFSLIAIVIFVLPKYFSINTTITFQFFASILFLIGPLETLISSMQSVTRANVSLENIYKLENDLNEAISELEDRNPDINSFKFEKIELIDVCFRYRQTHTDDKFEIGPINMNIEEGEILFITGGNGTGKTTLFKIITGLYIPSSGYIRINGQQLSLENSQSYREMFTAIFDDFHLFQHLYGIVNINLDDLNSILKRLQLEYKTHYENGRFTSVNLSRGQKKRLAYTISYLENRQIFVFDEFAADQDPVFKKYFYYTILPELKAKGKTVVAITHDDNYFHACDRLIKMDNGKFVDYKN